MPLPPCLFSRAATMPAHLVAKHLLLAAALVVVPPAPLQAAPMLPPAVAAVLQRERIPAEALSVVVEEVGAEANAGGANAAGSPPARSVRLRHQADRPLNPASLMKLLTTYAALDLLGPAWTWNTPVWLNGEVHDGVLDGSLIIQGRGDPKLVLERVWLLLRRVQQAGVREIRGDIVLDGSVFAPPRAAPGDFDNEPLRPYNVRADALLLNQKTVVYRFTPDTARQVAVVSADPVLAGAAVQAEVPLAAGACGDWRGALRARFEEPSNVRFEGRYAEACGERQWPVADQQPQTYAARLIAQMWEDAGGRLAGRVREGSAPTATPPSFEFASPPLAEVVRDINKYSNNVMAQQLFLTLGLERGGQGSPEAAREVLLRWLADRLRLPAAALHGLQLDNGSGLSRDTRLTAGLLSRMLQSAWRSPVMPDLVASLPATATDGTLRRSQAPAGRAHLKTGSLRDVAGVAGYVLGDSGRRYLVVAIVNHPNAAAARPAFDALVQWTLDDGPAGGPP
ncbi:D-alanyl-D-alanine carboxypeptidase/D-alanyl-D-alanine-endopeptidase [Aquincola sp. MAHUQ-54]|uniref:D-alanyl-D-alanine carboxypeptidase/D-alanyl-D-alanine-endopeptidase n=1 Tax=Aquincola agrisoli TaxID=3119538 RepID=A0AAW9Q8A1_9BURK